jgi:D-glycero-D-manno-heptose 1,7-bisphosphate phosphatase
VNSKTKALFLDRDGTLIVDKHYLHDPNEVELIDGTVEALRLAIDKGYKLFLLTNQSGIGRGMFELKDAQMCNQRMIEMIGIADNLFAEICIAPEAPDQESRYRKPSPAFILEMIEKYNLNKKDCWMIGDRDADLEAGIAAGVKSVYVKTGKVANEKVREYIEKGKTQEFDDFRAFAQNTLSV